MSLTGTSMSSVHFSSHFMRSTDSSAALDDDADALLDIGDEDTEDDHHASLPVHPILLPKLSCGAHEHNICSAKTRSLLHGGSMYDV